MRRISYWPGAHRLVYLDENATPEFWDGRWEAEGRPPPVTPRDEVVTVTPRYLAAGSKVLEGGCGRGNKVEALRESGFQATGIDFAENTVRNARRDYPNLDIRKGDVRELDIDDNSFDGYWSIGVIEHFWDGYDEILSEAFRVLRPGGVLFLTAPWLSPYRQRKARRGGFPEADYATPPENFYQFALARDEVSANLEKHGFELLSWRGLASEVSLQADAKLFRKPIDWLYATRGSIGKRILRRVVSSGLNGYCGHSFLAVARASEVAKSI